MIGSPSVLLTSRPANTLSDSADIRIVSLLRRMTGSQLIIVIARGPRLTRRCTAEVIALGSNIVHSSASPFRMSRAIVKITRREGVKGSSVSFLATLTLDFGGLGAGGTQALLASFTNSVKVVKVTLVLSLSANIGRCVRGMRRRALSRCPLRVRDANFSLASVVIKVSDTSTSSGGASGRGSSAGGGSGSRIGMVRVIAGVFSAVSSGSLNTLGGCLSANGDKIRRCAGTVRCGCDVSPRVCGRGGSDVHRIGPSRSFSTVKLNSSVDAGDVVSSVVDASIFCRVPRDDGLCRGRCRIRGNR